MGCGCGRNSSRISSPTRSVRSARPSGIRANSSIRRTNNTRPISFNIISTKAASSEDLKKRKKKCKKCPFVNGTELGKRCRKTNRLVSRIIADIHFRCPINRF
jgi:hypothetical protein